MTLSASATFTVADQTPVTVAADAVVQPPVGFGTGGRGRLVHPTLGAYDYAVTPDEVENCDGDVLIAPVWSHAMTLGGAVDALWPGYLRDALIVERWRNGDVGCPIDHLRQIWQLFANPPDPVTGTPVVWTPNYINANSYNVAIVSVRSGGSAYRLDLRLARWGYAPQPVELSLRILGYAS
jgi:hypothetical protein